MGGKAFPYSEAQVIEALRKQGGSMCGRDMARLYPLAGDKQWSRKLYGMYQKGLVERPGYNRYRVAGRPGMAQPVLSERQRSLAVERIFFAVRVSEANEENYGVLRTEAQLKEAIRKGAIKAEDDIRAFKSAGPCLVETRIDVVVKEALGRGESAEG